MRGRRKGTRAEVAAYDQAMRELQALGRIREETPEYHRLNGRANDLAAPLSGWQQSAWATSLRIDRADRRQQRSRGRSR